MRAGIPPDANVPEREPDAPIAPRGRRVRVALGDPFADAPTRREDAAEPTEPVTLRVPASAPVPDEREDVPIKSGRQVAACIPASDGT